MKTYTTVQGDLWDSIAYRQLGSTGHTDKLINANLQYRDIYIFPAGVTLVLPDIPEDGNKSTNLPPWKQKK